MCEWRTLEGHEEFLEEVRMKGLEAGKRVVYERKKCAKNI
jgi:hypothetical protein